MSHPLCRLFGILVFFCAVMSPLDAADQTPPQVETYKTVGDVSLTMNIYKPTESPPGKAMPAIVLFFGGGWRNGDPNKYDRDARYFASRGLVAICPDYRTASRHETTVADAIKDARSAMRYIRGNAARLGIDPARIAAGGKSAGGHLATACAVLPIGDEAGEDLTVNCRPDALVLFSPPLVLAPDASLTLSPAGEKFLAGWNHACEPLSPFHHVGADAPPTIIFHGDADVTVPIELSRAYARKASAAGSRCELVEVPKAAHRFQGEDLVLVMEKADTFLQELGFLTGPPTSAAFFATP